MTVKAVTKYQSSDGKLHDSIVDARKYDALQQVIDNLRKYFNGQQLSTLHLTIANDPALAVILRNHCNKVLDYHRRHGKLSGPEVTATATMKSN